MSDDRCPGTSEAHEAASPTAAPRKAASPGPRTSPRTGRRPVIMTALLGAAALAGCSRGESPQASQQTTQRAPGVPTSSTAEPEAAATAPAPAAPSSQPAPADPLEGWSLEQKVGQLIMVGVEADAPSPASSAAVTDHHVGNIFVAGRTQAGSQSVSGVIGSLTGLVSADTTRDTPMLVATDQEGGQVQVLSGPGFSSLPSAAEQASLPGEQLRASARAWGAELAGCGVTMNLAPVADLVDTASPASNEPIGRWGREYGYDAASVTAQAMAFAGGMEAAGVIATYKHFPGLGRVTQNTDTSASVTDTITSRTGDAAVSVFAGAIAGGARAIMMSSALYTLIDATAPAVFSQVVVTDMLRSEMGFTGVIMTDDVSGAAQVQDVEAGERAVRAVAAGCDLVLASADPATAGPMAQALVAAAQADPAMAARVDESVLRVLALKGVGQG